MSVSRSQALAFLKEVVGSKSVRLVCAGILGDDGVPSADDFSSRNAEQLDRCETFIAHAKACLSIFEVELRHRERQKEIDFTKPKKKTKKMKGSEPATGGKKAKTAKKKTTTKKGKKS